jgi:exodeoxyribonuclease V alpha subunit
MPDGAVLAVLDGVLERVTFANPETGYTIARIAPERGQRLGADLVTAVGPLLGAQVGEFLRLRGRWSSHPRYGRQFEVHSYTTTLPATAAGIQRYLGSGLIKGIGPVMAERMVAPHQRRADAVARRLLGLLLVWLRGRRPDRRAGGGHRGAADPG